MNIVKRIFKCRSWCHFWCDQTCWKTLESRWCQRKSFLESGSLISYTVGLWGRFLWLEASGPQMGVTWHPWPDWSELTTINWDKGTRPISLLTTAIMMIIKSSPVMYGQAWYKVTQQYDQSRFALIFGRSLRCNHLFVGLLSTFPKKNPCKSLHNNYFVHKHQLGGGNKSLG